MAGQVVILKGIRMYWGDLYRPGDRENDKGEKKYGITAIFEKTSDAAKVAQAAFVATAQEVFGPNWQNIVGAMEASKKCIRSGDSYLTKAGEQRPEFIGKLYIVARNKAQPAIVAARTHNGQFVHVAEDNRPYINGALVDLPFAVKAPYNGCYVNAKVEISAMKAKDTIPNQVFGRLLAVQFAADGEAFGAAAGTPEGFDINDGDTGADAAFGTPAAATSVDNLFG